jgi:hypothetical protein
MLYYVRIHCSVSDYRKQSYPNFDKYIINFVKLFNIKFIGKIFKNSTLTLQKAYCISIIENNKYLFSTIRNIEHMWIQVFYMVKKHNFYC